MNMISSKKFLQLRKAYKSHEAYCSTLDTLIYCAYVWIS